MPFAYPKPRAAALALALAILVAACGREDPDALLASARDYLAKGDRQAAAVQLKSALQQKESGEARYLLASLHLDAGDYSAAEVQLRQAAQARHPADQVQPALARALLGMGEFRKLEEELGPTRLTNPAADSALKVALGEALVAQGKPAEARKAFAAAREADPANAAARVGEARVAITEGRHGDALAVADEVLAAQPADVRALMLKADALVAMGKAAEAATVLDEVLRKDPHHAQAHFTRVQLLMSTERYDAATAAVDEFKKSLPRDVRWHYLKAVLAFRQGDAPRARDEVMHVLNVVPDHGPSRLLAGALEYQLDSLATAADHLRKVLAQAPENLYARNLLAATYLRQGQPGKAEEAIAPALKQAPDDPAVLRTAGEVAFANNRLAEAARFYDRAMAKEKDTSFSQTRLAEIRLAGGETERALDDLARASRQDAQNYQADLSLVTTHLSRKEFDKADAAAATLAKKQPDNPLTWTVKGLIAIGRKDVATARAHLDKALAIKADYVPAARAQASLDIAEGRHEAARARFEAILAKDPANEAALLSLAQAQGAGGAPPREVADTLDRAVKANPTSVAARLELIRHHGKAGDTRQALAAAQSANAAIANEPKILDALGLAQLAAGEVHQAIETFSALAQALPDSPLPQMRLASAGAVAKQRDQPIQALRRALGMKPELAEARRGIVQLQLAAGKPAEAMKEAKAAQQARPNDPVGYELEGDVLLSQKKPQEAARAYAEAARRGGDGRLKARELAALREAGRGDAAAAAAAAWLRDHPDDAAVRFDLANAAMKDGRHDEAVRGYRELSTRQPDNAVLLNNLALALAARKDPEALAVAERAYARAPGNASVQDTYGWLLVNAGQEKRGLELLALAAPHSTGARLHLARALLKQGDKDGARRELEAVAASGKPGASEAKQLLAGL